MHLFHSAVILMVILCVYSANTALNTFYIYIYIYISAPRITILGNLKRGIQIFDKLFNLNGFDQTILKQTVRTLQN